MSLSIEFLLKVFFLGLGVFAFNKFIVPKLADLFVKNKYKSKNSRASLDHMIKLKMTELSDKNLLQGTESNNQTTKMPTSPKDSLIMQLKEKNKYKNYYKNNCHYFERIKVFSLKNTC